MTASFNDAQALERYKSRYKRQDQVFAFLNCLVGLVITSKKTALPSSVHRVLISNAGHLGDAIISTALFPVLKHAFPNATFDFLTDPASKAALDGHPFLNQVFYFEHWRSSRAPLPLWRKILRCYCQIPKIAQRLRQENYDIAIDLHAWHPNSLLLFWLAKIPVRAGFGRVGYASTLTHPTVFTYDRRHELDQQLDVLRALGLSEDALALAAPSLPPIADKDREKAQSLVGAGARYCVLHPTSSTPIRDWTLQGWADLARHLLAKGFLPIITGAGSRDATLAQQIRQRVPQTLSLVNKASWSELTAILEKAECVFSVETSVGHVAAALGRPVVAIYGGMADPLHWSPIGSSVATHIVPCSPCYNKRGCATRDCLTRLSVTEVEQASPILF